LADIEFAVPLPPGDESQQRSFLNLCGDKAWEAVGKLLPRTRRRWPTQEKIRCEVTLYTALLKSHPDKFMSPIVNAIGGVLWHPKTSFPLVIVQQEISESERIVVKVTKRKLVSEDGAGKHYEW
jgi:hypothetical protein